MTMYSGWVNFRPSFGDGEVGKGTASVLDKFPQDTGLSIAVSVVDAIIQGEDYSPTAPKLSTKEEVEWTMMVLAYGLRLPLDNEETMWKCIHIYQDWLSALTPAPSVRVPPCVRRKPEFYAQRIFEQFEGLFLPREEPLASKKVRVHIRLTLLVLAVTQRITNTTKLSRLTWETILMTLVRIADRLLAPPAGLYGSLAEQIGERLIKVLLSLWIHCCSQHFPAPPLWKTLQEKITCWRHHRFVVEEWTHVTLQLTQTVVRYLYGPSHGAELCLSAQYEDGTQRVQRCVMEPDCLVQCWFRLLHVLGHPVELSQRATIASAPGFLQV